MTKEEADSLKTGDVVYLIHCNIDGTKISLLRESTVYIRGFLHGKPLLSHSPKWNTASWSGDLETFHKDCWCLPSGVEQACIGMATRVLAQRFNEAKAKMQEAKDEFDRIAGTTPQSLIDMESIKAVIEAVDASRRFLE